jgi:hypothetical protein
MCLNVNKIVVPNEKPIVSPATTQVAQEITPIIAITEQIQLEQNLVDSLKDGKAVASINISDDPPLTKGEVLFTKILAGLPDIDAEPDGGKDNKIFSLKGNQADQLDDLIKKGLKDFGLKNDIGLTVINIANILKFNDGKIDNVVDIPANYKKGAHQLSVELKQQLEDDIQIKKGMLADYQQKSKDPNEYVPPFFITDEQKGIKELENTLKELY